MTCYHEDTSFIKGCLIGVYAGLDNCSLCGSINNADVHEVEETTVLDEKKTQYVKEPPSKVRKAIGDTQDILWFNYCPRCGEKIDWEKEA